MISSVGRHNLAQKDRIMEIYHIVKNEVQL